jgi:hypothetical protein
MLLQYGAERFFVMKYASTLWVFFFCNSFVATAQVLPTSSGSCSVSGSGIMGCEWLSTPPVRWAEGNKSNNSAPKGRTEVFVTRFTLSPGAPLNSLVEGHEVLIVGMSDGELVNETSSPRTNISLWNGSVVFMPKEDHYLLRNNGKQDVQLLVVDVRR